MAKPALEEPREPGLLDGRVLSRLQHAVQLAGIADEVDASVAWGPEVMDVQLWSSGAGEIGIDQLAAVAALLRSTHPDGRSIRVRLASRSVATAAAPA